MSFGFLFCVFRLLWVCLVDCCYCLVLFVCGFNGLCL